MPPILDPMARPDDPLFDDRRTPAVEHRDDIVRRSLTRAVAWLTKILEPPRGISVAP